MGAKIKLSLALVAMLMLVIGGCTSKAPTVSGGYDQGTTIPDAAVVNKGPKKRIAVIEFNNKTPNRRMNLGDVAAEILTTELFKSGNFIMIERGDLDKVLDENRRSREADIDPATAAQTGRVLGVNAVVIGNITNYSTKVEGIESFGYKKKIQTAEVTVDIKVIDVNTGQIIYADSGTGRFQIEVSEFLGQGQRASYDEGLATDALRAAIVQFTGNVVRQLNYIEWSGKIAQVQGGRVYINAGQRTGLKRGDQLVVRGKGQSITDPDTGLVLGTAPGAQVGELEVSEFFGDDAAICRIVSGSGFGRGDMVWIKQ
ncbi:MAG: CsgG/HfaB family protein [Candidatus Alcyoniella australis]|nr:CsgG/HfaB family protein [Candidatus Alcyoniella australis]